MKKKAEKVDGLSPTDRAKVRSAIRQVWQRSHPRKLAVARVTDKEGFQYCEECGKKCAKVQIDHIIPVGDILVGGIKRMFCPSKGLRGLCKECHKIKTKKDKDESKNKN